MTAEADVLRPVLLRPGDDTARLALADWYEEHGQAGRAEFIRWQIDKARGVACGYDVNRRMVRLVRKHKADWCAPVLPWPLSGCQGASGNEYWVSGRVEGPAGVAAAEVRFCRGLPCQAAVFSFSAALTHIGSMLARWPLEAVRIAGVNWRVHIFDQSGGAWAVVRHGIDCRADRVFRDRDEMVAGVGPWLRGLYETEYAA